MNLPRKENDNRGRASTEISRAGEDIRPTTGVVGDRSQSPPPAPTPQSYNQDFGHPERAAPQRGEFWRHFKGGKLYQVIGFTIDPDGDLNVVYKEAWGPPLIPYSQKVSRFIGDHESGVRRFKRADDLKGG